VSPLLVSALSVALLDILLRPSIHLLLLGTADSSGELACVDAGTSCPYKW
jgi:hypothetical protein